MTPFKTIIFCVSCLLLFTGATVCIDAKIVFRVDDDIWVMNDDGTGRRRLTHNTTTKDSNPRWSPDGTKIAFTRFMDKENIQTSSELFVMNADGTDLERLTHNNVADGYPSWSPDGHHIAFRSSRSGNYEVHAIELTSQTITQLTGLKEGNLGSTAPDWSPDGTHITFERFMQVPGISSKNIYVMSADGQHPRPLIPDPKIDAPPTFRFFPRWSADGQQILSYEVKWLGEERKRSIFVVAIGGGKQEIRDITDRLSNNFLIAGVSWMENDRAILFSIKKNDQPTPNYNLYRYTFQSRGLRRLTLMASDEKWPDWTEGALSVSPHGKLPTQWGEIKQAYHEPR